MVKEDIQWEETSGSQLCSVGRESHTAGRTKQTAADLGELHRQEDLEGARPASFWGLLGRQSCESPSCTAALKGCSSGGGGGEVLSPPPGHHPILLPSSMNPLALPLSASGCHSQCQCLRSSDTLSVRMTFTPGVPDNQHPGVLLPASLSLCSLLSHRLSALCLSESVPSQGKHVFGLL